MALTTAGSQQLAQLLAGSGLAYDAVNAYIGVGDGDTAFSLDQTDLQGANTFRRAMDTGYPQITGNVIKFRATFAAAEANFAWHEWGVFNASTGGVMLDRVVEDNGTKLSNQEWVLELTITLNSIT